MKYSQHGGGATRLDGLSALHELSITKRMKSRKIAGRAEMWYRTEHSARTDVHVPNKEALFCLFCLVIRFLLFQS